MCGSRSQVASRSVVEVALKQPWGPDAKVSEVYEAGAKYATQTLRNLIESNPDVRIHGEVVVETVLTKK